eukprot:9895124-Alexandrium_andersonii.AAC.1
MQDVARLRAQRLPARAHAPPPELQDSGSAVWWLCGGCVVAVWWLCGGRGLNLSGPSAGGRKQAT